MDIVLDGITKRYEYKTVLDGLSLKFEAGKIHALLGENGAGKSTTAAILCGALQPDSGRILFDGKTVILKNERDATERGIVLVQQRPLLAESISVFENIMLGSEYAQQLSKKEFTERVNNECKEVVPQLNLHALVRDTGGDGRFYTSFVAALIKNPSVLILDEPSALLDWEQRRALYAEIRKLAQQGKNVIIITHSKEEATLYCDTVSLLEKGKLKIGNSQFIIDNYTKDNFDNKNDSYHLEKTATSNNSNNIQTNIEAQKISSHDNYALHIMHYALITSRPKNRPAIFDISFSAQSGQISLITGLAESGLSTLENVVTGMEHAKTNGTFTIESGDNVKTISFDKRMYTPAFLRNAPELTAAILPTDRTFRAANPHLTIEQMLTAHYTGKNHAEYAERLIAKAGISIKRTEKASALSGGMLQRLILARELEQNPKLIIFCEPLQGLDFAASEKTCSLLYDCAKNRSAVIVLTAADFPKELCARHYKLDSGRLRQI